MPYPLAGAVGALREQDHPDDPGDRRHRGPIADRHVGEAERLEDQRQEEALAVDAKADQQRDAGQHHQLRADDRPRRRQMAADRRVAFGLQLGSRAIRVPAGRAMRRRPARRAAQTGTAPPSARVGRPSARNTHCQPAMPKPSVEPQQIGRYRADEDAGRGADRKEHPHRAAAVARREPAGHEEGDPGEEPRFGHPQQKAGNDKARDTRRQRRPRRAQPPGHRDQRNPAPRADTRQRRVRRHLEQYIAPEESAGAEPVSRRRQAQRLVHRQRRDRDVEAVQHIDAVAKTEQGQKPHTPPCASRQLRGRAPSFPPAKLCRLCQHTQDRRGTGKRLREQPAGHVIVRGLDHGQTARRNRQQKSRTRPGPQPREGMAARASTVFFTSASRLRWRSICGTRARCLWPGCTGPGKTEGRLILPRLLTRAPP